MRMKSLGSARRMKGFAGASTRDATVDVRVTLLSLNKHCFWRVWHKLASRDRSHRLACAAVSPGGGVFLTLDK